MLSMVVAWISLSSAKRNLMMASTAKTTRSALGLVEMGNNLYLTWLRFSYQQLGDSFANERLSQRKAIRIN